MRAQTMLRVRKEGRTSVESFSPSPDDVQYDDVRGLDALRDGEDIIDPESRKQRVNKKVVLRSKTTEVRSNLKARHATDVPYCTDPCGILRGNCGVVRQMEIWVYTF